MAIFIAVIGFLLTGVFIIMIAFFVQATLRSRGKVPRLDLEQRRHKRKTGVLWGLILLALAYSSLLPYLHTLTSIPLLDGSIGAALGLYICAHPAANAVNMLFFEPDMLRQLSEWSVVRWLALNLLVLLAGWMVLFIGITRLVNRTV
jgi:hypothetical protein